MTIAPVAYLASSVLASAAVGTAVFTGGILPAAALLAGAALSLTSLKVAKQWEKVVLLRNGRFHAMKEPGLFFAMPFIDSIADAVDTRIITSEFKADSVLTKDTVSVNVDAVVFWMVQDPKKAALEVSDFRLSVSQVAQTTLREVISSVALTTLMADRRTLDEKLCDDLAKKTAEWGVSVTSVEIKDVAIPEGLQDAMSRQAQAERERDARVTLAEAEVRIAEEISKAAKVYGANPGAMALRQMGLTYEMGRNGATVVIPSDMVGSMSGVAGALALGKAEAER